MDGYIRVSRRLGREGPGYISPDVQREAIKRWAAYKDVEVDETAISATLPHQRSQLTHAD
jgi:hypothetical protein